MERQTELGPARWEANKTGCNITTSTAQMTLDDQATLDKETDFMRNNLFRKGAEGSLMRVRVHSINHGQHAAMRAVVERGSDQHNSLFLLGERPPQAKTREDHASTPHHEPHLEQTGTTAEKRKAWIHVLPLYLAKGAQWLQGSEGFAVKELISEGHIAHGQEQACCLSAAWNSISSNKALEVDRLPNRLACSHSFVWSVFLSNLVQACPVPPVSNICIQRIVRDASATISSKHIHRSCGGYTPKLR